MAVSSIASAIVAMASMKKAEKAQEEQKAQQDQLIAEQEKARQDAEAQRKKEEDIQNSELQVTSNKSARGRQRALAKGAQGRSSTLLTSPLGDVGTLEGGKKTLLGE